MRNKVFSKKSGVTMIALVTTIIILLIIAGITIAVLTGENGIIARANRSQYAQEVSDVREDLMQKWYVLLDETKRQYLTNEELADELLNKLKQTDKDAQVEWVEANDTIEISYKGHEFEIQANKYITANRETAKREIKEKWDQIKGDSSYPTTTDKTNKLAEELGIDPSKVTPGNESNADVRIEDYNGYNEEIKTGDNGETVVEIAKAKETDKAKVGEVTISPTSLEIFEGSEASFGITAETSGDTSYRWFSTDRNATVGGKTINGATSDTLTIKDAKTSDSKYYYCEISANQGGKTKREKSSAVKLTVVPKITVAELENDNITVNKGEKVEIKLKDDIGENANTTYQWYKNDKDSNTGGTPIEGANSSTFEKENMTEEDDGYYYLVITQKAGDETNTVTTDPAKVNVKIPVSIDKEPSNVSCLEGDSVEVKVETKGNGKITYQWYKNDENSNTGGTPIEGATSEMLTINPISTDDDAYYYCEIRQIYEPDGTDTTIKTTPAKISVEEKVGIKTQPSSQEVIEGKKATFIVETKGGGDISYQWYKNDKNSNEGGTPIENTNSNTYEKQSVGTGDAGYYYVVVTQKCNGHTETVTSEAVQLTVKPVTISATETNVSMYIVDSNKDVTITGDNLGTLNIDTPSNNNIAEVTLQNDKLTITPKGVGTTSVTVKESNAGKTVTINIEIKKPTTQVTITPETTTVVYDTENIIKATATNTPAIDGTWTVTSSNTNAVEIISGNGSTAKNGEETQIKYKAKAATEEETTITITFTPNDTTNYDTITKTVKISKINKIDATNPTTVTGYTGAYDGKPHTITVSNDYVGGTLQYSTDGTNWSTTKPTITNFGEITVYVRVLGDSNHNTTEPITVKMKVGTTTMTVEAGNYTGTYDGKSHTITLNVTTPSSGYEIYYSTTKALTSDDISTAEKRAAAGASTTKPSRTDAGTTTVYWYIKSNNANYADKLNFNTITINRKALTESSLQVQVGPNSNLNDWNINNTSYQGRFNMTYNENTQMTDIVYTGGSGWESLYMPIVTTPGQTYTFTCDYKNLVAFTTLNSNGYDGIGLQALNSVPKNSNNIDNGNAIETSYLPKAQNATVQTYSLTFTATGPITYISFNLGMCQDNKQLQFSIGNFTLSNNWAYIYDGTAKTVTTVVKDTTTNKIITKGTDYSISYSNNTNIGTATATLTGIGNYSDTKTAEFRIAKKPAADITYDYNLGNTLLQTYEAGTYSNTGYNVNWDEDFTIETTVNVPTLGKRYIIAGGFDGTSKKELQLEINTSNALRVYIGTGGHDKTSGTIKAGEDITVTFKWTASTKSYVATAVGATTGTITISNNNVAGTTYDTSGTAANGLRIGCADYRGNTTTFKPITVKSFKATGTQDYNAAVIIPTADKQGFTFNGWYTAASGGTQVTSATTVPQSAITYYAHWTANNYTANFNGNGGTDGTAITKAYGTALGTLPSSTRDGYTFNGWYTEASGGTQISTTTPMPLNGATYYAHWVDDVKPTITSATPSATWDVANYVDFNATDAGAGINGYAITTSATAPTEWIPVVDVVEAHTETKQELSAAWARVFHHNTHWGKVLYADETEAKSADTVDKYSVLGNIANYKNSTNWEFLLQYPELTGYNRWTQTGNPITTNNETVGYTAVGTPSWTNNSWAGIALSSTPTATFIDGSPAVGNWHYAIGAYSRWRCGIPGPTTGNSHVNLWSRIDNLTNTTSTNLTRRLGDLKENRKYYVWVKDNNGNTNYREVTTSKVDITKPTISITSTNNVAASQTATLTLGDNIGVVAYYWGTSNPETTNVSWTDITSTTSTTVTKTVSGNGTYYLAVQDAAGNRAVTNKTFYKTTLIPAKGSVTPTSIVTMAGNSVNLPNPTATGATFTGWYTDITAGTKQNTAYTPTSNLTLYGHWTQSTYQLSVNPNGGTWNSSTSTQTFNQYYGTDKTIANPTRPGYDFTGWTLTGSGWLGQSLHTDSKFASGLNGVSVYNNTGNGTVTVTQQTKSADNWVGGNELKVVTSKTATPGMGGFFHNTTAAASQSFIHVFIAKLPVGYSFHEAMNSIGNGIPRTGTWLTSRAGTGGFEVYAYRVDCGSTGPFSTFGHVYVEASSLDAPTFYVAYSDVINVTNTKGTKYVFGSAAGTLTANWTPSTYTVTYNANGGSVTPTSATVTYGSAYGTLPTPTRAGYAFKGWNGKNLFNKDATPINTSTYIKGDGTTASSAEYSLYQINVKPNTTYTITNSGKSTAPGYVVYNSSGTRLAGANFANTANITFTTPANSAYMKFSVVTQTTSNRYDKEIFQIEEGSSATTYEPYYLASTTTVTQTANHTLTAIWADETKPTKPTITAKFVSGDAAYTSGSWATSQVYTTITTTEAGSGIKEIQFSKDNKATWTKLNLAKSGGIQQNGTTFTGQEIWTDTDGRNDTIYIRVIDNEGNISDVSDAFIIKYDKSGPTITASSITYGANLSIKLEDAYSGVTGWQVTNSSTAPTSGWTEFTAVASKTVSKSGLTAGTWYVWAKDAAGNTQSKQITVSKAEMTLTSANYTGAYDGNSHTITGPTVTAPSSGTTVYYSTTTALTASNYTNTSIASTTKPTRTDVGTTTVYWYVASNNSNYNDKSGSNTITISPSTTLMSYTNSDYSGVYDGSNHSITLNVTTPTGCTLYYSTSTALTSSNYTNTSVASTTKPTRKDVGTTTVYWYIKSGSANYADKSGSNKITITQANNPIAVSNPATQYTGATVDLASLVSGAQGTVTYAIKTNGTTTESTISGSKVTLGAMNSSNDDNQSVVVTVSAAGNTNYKSGSKDITITVQKYTRTIAFASSVPASIQYNKTATASVTVSGSGGTASAASAATFATNNANVIAVSGTNNSVLTAKASSGSATITATLPRTTTVKQATTTKSISTAKLNLTAPAQSGSLTYSKAEQSPSWNTNYNTTYMTLGGTTKGTNATSYNATFTLKDTTNTQWSDGTTAAKTVAWTIGAYNLSNATIASIANQTYTGSQIKPTPAATVPLPSGSTTTLTNNTDFTYSYGTNKTVATNGGSVTITGKGNYTGTKTANFNIVKKSLTVPAQSGSLTYSKAEQSPSWNTNYSTTWMTLGGTTSGTNATSYNATFTLKDTTNTQWSDGTTAAKTVAWSIGAYNLSNATIAAIANQTYTGSQIKPTPAVTVPLPSGSTTTLTNNTDFTYSYGANKTVATNGGSLTITGKGNYTGTKTANFNIVKKSLTVPAQSGSLTYSKAEQSPSWNTNYSTTWMTLGGTTSGTNATSYNATFTLKDTTNTQWSDGTTAAKTVAWTIGAYNLSNATIASIANQTYTGSQIKPTPAATVPLPSGSTTTLTNNTDFTYSYGTNKTVATNGGSVTITGKGNYTGTKTANFNIVKKSLTVPTQSGSLTYSGSSQSPSWNSNYSTTWMTLGGTTSGTNATSYNATFTLKDTTNTQWSDGTTAAKTVAWTIGKKAPSFSIDKTTMSLTYGGSNGTITITYDGDGTLSATSSATGVATVSLSGKTVTVTPKGVGTTTVTIKAAAGTNYSAGTDKTCTVTVGAAMMTVSSGNYSGTYDKASHTITGPTVTVPSSGYTIYYSTTMALTSSNYNDTSTASGHPGSTTTKPSRTNAGTTTVYWYVKSGSTNYSDKSGSNTIKINPALIAAPTNVTVTTAGYVTWTNSANATSYEISTKSDFSENKVTATTGATATDYLAKIIAATGTRTVYVRGVNSDTTNYTTPGASANKAVTVYQTKFQSNNTTMGAVDTATYNVISGATVSASSNKLTINGVTTGTTTKALKTVTATPTTGYKFSSWSKTSGGITAATTITATFAGKTYKLLGNIAKEESLNLSLTAPDTAKLNNGVYTLTKSAAYSGLFIPEGQLENGAKYVLTYKIQKTSGKLVNIGGHSLAATQTAFTIDGNASSAEYHTPATNMSDNTSVHTIRFEFTYNPSGTTNTNKGIYIQPNRGVTDSIVINISEVNLYKVLNSTAKAYNEAYTSTELTAPIRGGYMFNGWYNNSSYTTQLTTSNKFNTDGATFTNIATEGTEAYVYARWTDVYLKAETTGTSTVKTSAFLGTSITRDKIKAISFTNSISGHTVDNSTCFDVSSVANSGAVLMWVTKDSNNYYTVVIGQNGGVRANPDSSHLFEYIGYSMTATITLTNLNTSATTNMAYLFAGCVNVTSLNVSTFNTSNVTTMQRMFAGYPSDNVQVTMNLSTLTGLTNFNTSNCTYMGGMFMNQGGLTDIDLSSFNTANVTNMSDMFNGANSVDGVFPSKLTRITFGSNFKTNKVTAFNSMFPDNPLLTSLDVSGFDTSSGTNMQYMFANCKALTTINVSGFNTANVTNMQYMFSQCQGLTTLDVSGFNTGKVTNMGCMFYYCEKLTSLSVQNWNTSNVTDMHQLFDLCTSLTTLNTGNFNTAKVTTMAWMFSNCQSLTSINVSSFNTSSATDLRGMFNACWGLTSNPNCANFDTSKVTHMNRMFERSTITAIDLSNFNTAKVTDMTQMFDKCNKLKTIFASSKFVTTAVTASTNMFRECTVINGGNGTTFDSTKIDKTYARLDGGTSSPGYLFNANSRSMTLIAGNTAQIWLSSPSQGWTVKTAANSSIATTTMNGNNIQVTGVAAGTTSVVMTRNGLNTDITISITVQQALYEVSDVASGKLKYQRSLKNAVAAMDTTKTPTIKVLANTSEADDVTISTSCTINTQTYSVTRTAGTITISDGKTLTVSGTGSLIRTKTENNGNALLLLQGSAVLKTANSPLLKARTWVINAQSQETHSLNLQGGYVWCDGYSTSYYSNCITLGGTSNSTINNTKIYKSGNCYTDGNDWNMGAFYILKKAGTVTLTGSTAVGTTEASLACIFLDGNPDTGNYSTCTITLKGNASLYPGGTTRNALRTHGKNCTFNFTEHAKAQSTGKADYLFASVFQPTTIHLESDGQFMSKSGVCGTAINAAYWNLYVTNGYYGWAQGKVFATVYKANGTGSTQSNFAPSYNTGTLKPYHFNGYSVVENGDVSYSCWKSKNSSGSWSAW